MGIFTKYMIKVGAKMANKHIFRGEMTEELHEYFTAIKENLVLLGREIVQSAEAIKDFEEKNPDNSMVRIHGDHGIVHYLLSDIEEIEGKLDPNEFFTYEHDREGSLIDDAWDMARRINGVLTNLMKSPNHFLALNKAHQYIKEVEHDLAMTSDIFARQDEILEKYIMVDPTRMVHRDPRHVEQISYDELHPDFQDHNIEDEYDDDAKTENLYDKLEKVPGHMKEKFIFGPR